MRGLAEGSSASSTAAPEAATPRIAKPERQPQARARPGAVEVDTDAHPDRREPALKLASARPEDMERPGTES
jgi:hypothetical protein